MTDTERAIACSTDPAWLARQLGAAPVGCGVLRPGDQVRFTGRSVPRDALAHDLLEAAAIYEVASCAFYLDEVYLRLKERPGLRFLRSMFELMERNELRAVAPVTATTPVGDIA